MLFVLGLRARVIDGDDDFARVLAGRREHIGRFVFAAELAIQIAHRGVVNECDRHFADLLARRKQDFSDKRRHLAPAHPRRGPADLDVGQLCGFRSLSARSYATTIFCTSGCRTTSLSPNSKNLIPSTLRRICRASRNPDFLPSGKSICVTSPVTTAFDPNPSRVRNIFICSGVVFCASPRMMNESLSVRPRMNASGAISMTPRSISLSTFSYPM